MGKEREGGEEREGGGLVRVWRLQRWWWGCMAAGRQRETRDSSSSSSSKMRGCGGGGARQTAVQGLRAADDATFRTCKSCIKGRQIDAGFCKAGEAIAAAATTSAKCVTAPCALQSLRSFPRETHLWRTAAGPWTTSTAAWAAAAHADSTGVAHKPRHASRQAGKCQSPTARPRDWRPVHHFRSSSGEWRRTRPTRRCGASWMRRAPGCAGSARGGLPGWRSRSPLAPPHAPTLCTLAVLPIPIHLRLRLPRRHSSRRWRCCRRCGPR